MDQLKTNCGTEKNQRLLELALSLDRNGQHKKSLEMLLQIKLDEPNFSKLDYWITTVKNNVVEEARSRRTSNNIRKAYRQQFDIAHEYGHQVPSKWRFKPKFREFSGTYRIRNRHVAYALIVFLLFVAWASVRNMRKFMLVVTPMTGELTCFKGTFFPYGWEKADQITVGLQPGWEDELENPKLAKQLQNGQIIIGTKKLDAAILNLYKTLGTNALKTKTIENQRIAIYYFKRIEHAQLRKEIAQEMAEAYYNLANLTYREVKDANAARQYLYTAQSYFPNYPGIDEFLKIIQPPAT